MPYSKKLIEHFENPRNVGSLDEENPRVGTAMIGNPACGDLMKMQVLISEEGIIEDVKFKTYGCGSAIAASSLATEWVKGKHYEEALKMCNLEIAQELELPPLKYHCSVLGEEAVHAAIEDYKKKNDLV